jgi:hypothetical protein
MTQSLASTSAVTSTTKLRYYDLKKNWRKVKRHLKDPILNEILVEDFNKFTLGLWNETFEHGQLPSDFERRQWWSIRSDEPKFRFCGYIRYVKVGACHWVVNFALRLATLVEPTREWRIITSDDHSTVWDGRGTLFEFNFQAFGVSPEECFTVAYDEELRPGEYIEAGFCRYD